MDPQAFDRLARSLGCPASRRHALGGLAGVVAVTLGGVRWPAGDGLTAHAGKKKCPSGQHLCNGVCVDLSRNPAHCGDCQTSCRPLGSGGRCCGGTCVDVLDADPNHCGACAVVCSAGEACVDGTCQSCPSGQTHCQSADGSARCVNLQTNEANCGRCGQACAAGRQCCAGSCVDVASDVQHCGACGAACDAFAHCCGGVCSFLDDLEHCGSCDFRCPAGTDGCDFTCSPSPMCCLPRQNSCRALDCGEFGCCGVPRVPSCTHCPAGTTCCEQFCVDLASDHQHCGSCNHACNNTSICADGACLPCPPGRVVCGDVCCLP